jgi:hypothetical protein
MPSLTCKKSINKCILYMLFKDNASTEWLYGCSDRCSPSMPKKKKRSDITTASLQKVLVQKDQYIWLLCYAKGSITKTLFIYMWRTARLTTRSKVLKKLRAAQLVSKFLSFYGYYSASNSLLLLPLNAVLILASYKINFNIILSSTPMFPSGFFSFSD